MKKGMKKKMKSKKGFSLVEIVIGLVIITLFLVATGSLINASYTNYRLIAQRNEALEVAMREMERILQSREIATNNATGERIYEAYSGDLTRDPVRVSTFIDRFGDTSDYVYDNVVKVTVIVEYKKSRKDTKTENITLESLKVIQ